MRPGEEFLCIRTVHSEGRPCFCEFTLESPLRKNGRQRRGSDENAEVRAQPGLAKLVQFKSSPLSTHPQLARGMHLPWNRSSGDNWE